MRSFPGLLCDQVLLILGQVELPNLLLNILVEGLLPEGQGAPHRVILYTRVGKLDHPSAQFLKGTATSKTEITPVQSFWTYNHQ